MINHHKHLSLPQLLTLGFLVVIAIGTVLLSLPIASSSGHHTNYLDAFFSATSATCVTGLSLFNTAAHWSIFGRTVLLVLVEIGGLGVMTFTILLFLFIKKKVDLTTQLLTQQSLSIQSTADTKNVVFIVVKISLLIQFIGSLLLFSDFIQKMSFLKAVGYSIFHSISAFCNAGLDLFPNSLSEMQTDPFFLIVISLLIISGSLGFIVWRDILLYKKQRYLTLHTKLALSTYLGLIGISFIVFLITERLFPQVPDLTFWQRITNTFFLSVTPRTAGFYSIPLSQISLSGILFIMILMLIGGTPGSTAGGIKTTTLGIILVRVWATLRQKKDATIFKRKIPQENISRSLTLVFLVSMVIVISSLILLITEKLPKGAGLEYVVFDVISAFGTTGFSMGLIPTLSTTGKLIIILNMFMGRVGIFTVMYSLLTSKKAENSFEYPEENIMIG